MKSGSQMEVGSRLSSVGKNTFPKFEMKKILEMKPPQRIVVKKIDDNIEIEDTEVFKLLLGYFNKAYGIELSTQDLLHSRGSFNAFINFVLNCVLKRYMIINIEAEDQFMYAIEKLRSKYLQNLRSMEKYYDEIIRTIYRPKGLSKKDQEVRDEMTLFEQAYSLMKMAFINKKMDNGERYFEHLKGVMEIILRELPDPNLNKILIALLHDVKENLPEYADVVRVIYGDYIADGVDSLSKKDRRLYLNEDEKIIYENCKDEKCRKEVEDLAKERRDDDYFGHLDNLNDDYLDDKFADRIYNLRNINAIKKEKSMHNVKITEKYFLHVALKRNKKVYDIMIEETKKNKEKFGF